MKPWREADDAQLRRAAAERVMGWVEASVPVSEDGYERVWGRDGRPVVAQRDWLLGWNRNELARVVLAASERFGPIAASIREDQTVWGMALRDPRAALVRLLELLFPEGMNDE